MLYYFLDPVLFYFLKFPRNYKCPSNSKIIFFWNKKVQEFTNGGTPEVVIQNQC